MRRMLWLSLDFDRIALKRLRVFEAAIELVKRASRGGFLLGLGFQHFKKRQHLSRDFGRGRLELFVHGVGDGHGRILSTR